MLAAELALTREEAQLAACALLDVLPERCFTQGEVPSAYTKLPGCKKMRQPSGIAYPVVVQGMIQ